MCWSMGASVAMVGIGAVATVVSARRGGSLVFPVTLGYFTFMEALQVAGYAVVDQCSSPANQTVAWLSILHIVFQPLFINAFAMELVPREVRARARVPVFVVCAVGVAVMLTQLQPFEWAGRCEPGAILCALEWCTISGDWHIGWDVPYNGLLVGVDQTLGMRWGFPSYMLAAFVLPLFYGAWRFVLFHLTFGPLLAAQLTSNPNEIPAIWCLFSIAIILVALSPWMRRLLEWRREAAPA